MRTATAAALASQIAVADGATAIGPGHLILALLDDPGAIAWRGVRADPSRASARSPPLRRGPLRPGGPPRSYC